MKEIDQTTLLSLAGEPAYKRGKAYFENGQVGDLNIQSNTIRAQVVGTQVYRVTLKHTTKLFEGSCDCPASDHFDFCKHCVATGLKYLETLQGKAQLMDSKAGDLLHNYLLTLEKSQLAEQLGELISDDKLLHDKWLLKAEIAAGKLDHKALKKRITKAIPYNRNLFHYAQVRTYFARVDLLAGSLADHLPTFKADDALMLIDYALQRICKALDTIDDSGGFRYYSVEILNELHVQTLPRLEWPDKKLAHYLLDLYFGPHDDLYPDILKNYLPLLSEQCSALFLAELQSQWDKLPALNSADEWNVKWQYLKIQQPLLDAAEIRSDIDTKIQLLTKTSVDCRDLLSLSELCLKHDRLEEAQHWLAQARQVFNNDDRRVWHEDESLTKQEVAILCYQQQFDQALALCWAQYQRHSSLQNYQHVCATAKLAKDNIDWHQKAVAYLETKKQPNRWFNRNNLIAELHLHAQQPGCALSLAKQHALDPSILLRVARANQDQPEQILPLYIRLADSKVQQGNNDAYHEAIALLKEIEKIMSEASCDEYHKAILGLHTKYKAKRNFIKWLREAFPELLG